MSVPICTVFLAGTPRSDDYLVDRLRDLTEAIDKSGKADAVGGCLGGSYGYGATFKNDVFEMRPFYWGDCQHEGDEEECRDITCPANLPNFKCGGFEVRWYKYIGRSMEVDGDGDGPGMRAGLEEMFARCFASLEVAS